MKHFTILIGIGLLCLFLFYGIFKLFQNDKVYRKTLGTVSKNYENKGGWNINNVSKPYLSIENENYLHWDAAIYNCISEQMYKTETSCYGLVSAAFFPLFPIFWKITNATPITISILNYFIFILSVSLLVVYLLPKGLFLRITTFSVLITLPTTIIYHIPYSEALFLLCMTIAAIGILKEKYLVYFIGIMLMSMVRPATVFVLLAILLTEIYIYFKNWNKDNFLKTCFLKPLPFLTGYLITFIIQYVSSGSPTAFYDAQKHWDGRIHKITKIFDWSVEGFGMNTFSIFFIAIPASIFLLFLFITVKKDKLILSQNSELSKVNYLLFVSLAYISGLFVFTLFTSGGNFHSFFRFIMASPLFYIGVLILIKNINALEIRKGLVIFGLLCVALCIYLKVVEYGGSRIQFPLTGLYMLMVTFFYLMIRRFLPRQLDIIVLLGIVLVNTIWNTYMLNIFFSNGWIFT